MPIKIPNDLPARETLENENIFVMTEYRALHQDIRPLKIAILNLMPTKIATETQLLRCLANTPLQIEIDLIQTSTYDSKNTSQSHLESFYKTFENIKDNTYDGMIITGAPVENMDFENVNYWSELCEIMEWTKTNVHSTYHICWAAQAGLYYHYGINKHPLDKKKFGDIPDITDKGYYTNSYHVDVREKIDAFSKFNFESQFQTISSGGTISYAEIPNLRHNLPALEELVKFIYDNIMYAEFNTKSDYCQVCGYDGEIIINDNLQII